MNFRLSTVLFLTALVGVGLAWFIERTILKNQLEDQRVAAEKFATEKSRGSAARSAAIATIELSHAFRFEDRDQFDNKVQFELVRCFWNLFRSRNIPSNPTSHFVIANDLLVQLGVTDVADFKSLIDSIPEFARMLLTDDGELIESFREFLLEVLERIDAQ